MDSEPPCVTAAAVPRVSYYHLRWVIAEDSGGFIRHRGPIQPGAVHTPPKEHPCESSLPDKWQGAAGRQMQLAQNRRGHRRLLRVPRHAVPPSTELSTGGYDGAQASPPKSDTAAGRAKSLSLTRLGTCEQGKDAAGAHLAPRASPPASPPCGGIGLSLRAINQRGGSPSENHLRHRVCKGIL